MSLTIKDPDAHKLAQGSARETGESMTSALTHAIRGRLEAVRRRKRDAMPAGIHAVRQRSSELLKGPYIDSAEWF
jgi:antitoxin VapB